MFNLYIRKVRVYLTGQSTSRLKPAMGLNMMDSRNQVIQNILKLVGHSRGQISVKVKYLQRDLTTEGKTLT